MAKSANTALPQTGMAILRQALLRLKASEPHCKVGLEFGRAKADREDQHDDQEEDDVQDDQQNDLQLCNHCLRVPQSAR